MKLRPCVIGLCLVALAAGCQSTPAEPTQTEVALPVGAVTAELMVEAVGCASCDLGIRKALVGLEGVLDVRKGTTKQHVLVDFMPDQIEAERIIDAVTEAGYTAEVLVHPPRT